MRLKHLPGQHNQKRHGYRYSRTTRDVDDPDFKAWFKGSKVVGKDGKPLVMYHGTSGEFFDSFSYEHASSNSLYGAGFYFTADPEIASTYVKSTGGSPEAIIKVNYNTSAADWKKLHEIIKKDAAKDPGNEIIADLDKSLDVYNTWSDDMGDFRVDQIREDLFNARLNTEFSPGEKKLYRKYIVDLLQRSNVDITMTIEPSMGGVLPVYLSIKKPFDADRTFRLADLRRMGLAYFKKMGGYKGSWKTPELEISEAWSNFVNEHTKTADGHELMQMLNQFYKTYYPARHTDKNTSIEVLKDLGYDGITHRGGDAMGGKKHRVWIAWEPNQVKSVFNQGEYNPDDPNMMKESKLKHLAGRHNQRRHGWRYGDGSARMPIDTDAEIGEYANRLSKRRAADKPILLGGYRDSQKRVADNRKKYFEAMEKDRSVLFDIEKRLDEKTAKLQKIKRSISEAEKRRDFSKKKLEQYTQYIADDLSGKQPFSDAEAANFARDEVKTLAEMVDRAEAEILELKQEKTALINSMDEIEYAERRKYAPQSSAARDAYLKDINADIALGQGMEAAADVRKTILAEFPDRDDSAGILADNMVKRKALVDKKNEIKKRYLIDSETVSGNLFDDKEYRQAENEILNLNLSESKLDLPKNRHYMVDDLLKLQKEMQSISINDIPAADKERYNYLLAEYARKRKEVDEYLNQRDAATKAMLYQKSGHLTKDVIVLMGDDKQGSMEKGLTEFDKFVGENALLNSGDPVTIGSCKDNESDAGRTAAMPKARRSYSAAGHVYIGSSGLSTRSIIHELGHVMEFKDPLVEKLVQAFYERRTRNDHLEKLNDVSASKGYDPDEVTKLDKFIEPYMGRWYGGTGLGSEILSMGLEYFYNDPAQLASRDPDYFDFIYSVVRIGNDSSVKLKHLMGQHNQKRHGWRFGMGSRMPVGEDQDVDEYSRRLTKRMTGSGLSDKQRVISEKRNKYLQMRLEKDNKVHALESRLAESSDAISSMFARDKELYTQLDNLLIKRGQAAAGVGLRGKRLSETQRERAIARVDKQLSKVRAEIRESAKQLYDAKTAEQTIIDELNKIRQNADWDGKIDAARSEYENAPEGDQALFEGREVARQVREKILKEFSSPDELSAKLAVVDEERNRLLEQKKAIKSKYLQDINGHKVYDNAYLDDPEFKKVMREVDYNNRRRDGAELPEHKKYLAERGMKAQKELDAFEKAHTDEGGRIILNDENVIKEHGRLIQNLLDADAATSDYLRGRNESARQMLYQGDRGSLVDDALLMIDDTTDGDIKYGLDEFDKLSGNNSMMKDGIVSVGRVDQNKLDIGREVPYYNPAGRSFEWHGHLFMRREEITERSIIHELGHVLERKDPLIERLVQEFYARRTVGETIKKLNETNPHEGYDDSEFTKLDKFIDSYMGKWYGGRHQGSEILSMGLQYFFKDPVELAMKDPDYFDFIYSVVRLGNVPGVTLKHLSGRHNQKRHGWRYGSVEELNRIDKRQRDTDPEEHAVYLDRVRQAIARRGALPVRRYRKPKDEIAKANPDKNAGKAVSCKLATEGKALPDMHYEGSLSLLNRVTGTLDINVFGDEKQLSSGYELYKKAVLDAMPGIDKEYNKTSEYGAENIEQYSRLNHEYFTDFNRGQLKQKVAENLSKRTGLNTLACSDLVQTWALSSNDTNAMSIDLQEAASKEFGLDLSDWQKQKVEKLRDPAARAESAKRLREEGIDVDLTDMGQKRVFLREMYSTTQDYLKKLGYSPDDEIVLFRGVDYAAVPKAARGGEAIDYKGNAMESWTFRPATTQIFGACMLMSKIKVKNILSVPMTGFGCLPENEFVVMGMNGGEVTLVF